MKLSKAQERAKGKLTNEWRTANMLKESMTTLGILVKKGLAEHKGHRFHDITYRRFTNSYRLKPGGDHER